jgi:hypothetical protein
VQKVTDASEKNVPPPSIENPIHFYQGTLRHIPEDGILRSNTARSESRCALRLRPVELVIKIEVAVEECRYFTVFSC